MTSRRRRRTGTASVLLVLALALAGYVLHAAGLLPTEESSAATDTRASATGGRSDDRGDQASTGTDVAVPKSAVRS